MGTVEKNGVVAGINSGKKKTDFPMRRCKWLLCTPKVFSFLLAGGLVERANLSEIQQYIVQLLCMVYSSTYFPPLDQFRTLDPPAGNMNRAKFACES